MEELELPDDHDWAQANWLSILKGAEVGEQSSQGNEASKGDSIRQSADGGDEQSGGNQTTESGKGQEETKDNGISTEGTEGRGVEDASIDSGTESKMASGQSDQEQTTDNTRGPDADASGGNGDSGGAPPGGVVVHTVTPTSPDTAPSRPDHTSNSNKRHGPKFKRHRHWRESSTA